MKKYIVIKKRPDNTYYEVYLQTDTDLYEHIKGTVNNTDHVIVSVINVSLKAY